MPDLEALGFHVVGYGCTTCIGNSGPLPEPVAQRDRGAATWWPPPCSPATATSRAASTRTCKANYLASPPLVVAYALAGTIDIDLTTRAARHRTRRRAGVPRDIWPTPGGDRRARGARIERPRCSPQPTRNVFDGNRSGTRCRCPRATCIAWNEDSTYIQEPPFFQGLTLRAGAARATSRARACWRCWATPSPPTTSRPRATSPRTARPGAT